MTSSKTDFIRVSPADGYRLWSPSYDTDPNPLLSLEFRTLAGKLERMAGKTFLDVACGTGRWTAYAAGRGARAVGVDISLEMLRKAARKPRLAGSVAQADALFLPLADEAADLILCSFCLGYMPCIEPLIVELARVVRRTGTVLVTDLHPCALSRGWRRTFRFGANVFEIESHGYSRGQLLEAGRSAGLQLRRIVEPRFGEPEKSAMRAAGKGSWISEVTAVPAVLAVEWGRR